LVEHPIPFDNILEAMQDLSIAGAAFEIAQIKAREIAANARAIGIGLSSEVRI
jgi:5-carboxymethyl-2-hydroxymuconate isomerase